MPQFDTTFFAGQIFWFVIVFLSCYLFNRFIFLPKLIRAFEDREKFMQSNIETAEKNLLEIKSIELELKELSEKKILEIGKIKSEASQKVRDMVDREVLALQKKVADAMVTVDKNVSLQREEMLKEVEKMVDEIAPKVVSVLLNEASGEGVVRKRGSR